MEATQRSVFENCLKSKKIIGSFNFIFEELKLGELDVSKDG